MTTLLPVPATPTPELPQPSRSRMVLLRVGVANMWEYPYDTRLEPEDGWMHLRGPNESGKSKILEVALPAVFDARFESRRLTPSGVESRPMRENLIGPHTTVESPVGYVFCEFGRVAADGTAEFFTCGYGARASRSGSDFTTWQFTLEQARIDIDVDLFPNRTPLSESSLAQAIEGRGRVFGRGDSQQEYRQAVNARLFDLTDDQYDRLWDLIIELRRPQLGSRLRVGELDAALRTSLPTITLSRLRDVTEAMDRIDQARRDRNQLAAALGHLRSYQQHERSYLAAVAVHAAAHVAAAVNIAEQHREQIRTRDAAIDLAVQEQVLRVAPADRTRRVTNVPWLEQQLRRYRTAATRLDALTAARHTTIEALERSKAFQQLDELKTLHENLRQFEGAQKDAEDRVRTSEPRRDAAKIQLQSAEEELEQSTEALGAIVASLQPTAAQLDLRDLAVRLADPTGDPERLVALLTDHRDILRSDADALKGLDKYLQERVAVSAALRRAEEGARQAADEARVLTRKRQVQADAAEAQWADDVTGWLAASPEPLEAHDPPLPTLLAEADVATVLSAVRTVIRAVDHTLEDDLAEHRQRIANLDHQLEDVNEERRHLEGAQEVTPDRPDWRTAAAATPLYRCVEPQPHLTDADAALLEAAMVAVGLADASVSIDGTIDLDDVTVDRAEPLDGPSLADLLVPAPDSPVDRVVISQILAAVSIDCDGDQGTVAVSVDGRWRAGLLHGRRSADGAPQLISQAARERAREQRLADLADHAQSLTLTRQQHRDAAGVLSGRRDALRAHQDALPSTAPANKAAGRAQEAADAAEKARQAAEEATQKADDADAVVGPARRAVHAEAQRRGRGAWADRVEAFRETVRQFSAPLPQLKLIVQAYVGHTKAVPLRLADVQQLDGELETLAAAIGKSEMQQAGVRNAISLIEQTLGDDADALQRKHRRWTNELTLYRDTVGPTLQHRIETLIGAHATAQADLQRHRDAWDDARAQITRSMRRFIDLHAAGALTPAAAKLGVDLPEDDPVVWSERTVRDFARAVLATTTLPQESDARIHQAGDRLKNAQQRIVTRRDELKQHLRPRFDPTEVPVDDSVVIMRCFHRNAHHDIDGLVGAVTDEIDAADRRLTEQDQQLIEEFLGGEVRSDLANTMAIARERVDTIKQLVASVETNSGRRMEMRWVAAPDSPDVADVITALSKAVHTAADQALIVAFFQQRLETARIPTGENDQRSNLERLAEELDYRNWFRFVFTINDPNMNLESHTPDARGFITLTDRVFGKGSGGSMSVLVHLPLLAAASSFYDSAADWAPRLIVLDEVLAGVDEGMTEEVLALCRSFDLDLVSTGYTDWLAYETVPALAIYDIHRDRAAHLVDVERYTWDGRHLDPDSA